MTAFTSSSKSDYGESAVTSGHAYKLVTKNVIYKILITQLILKALKTNEINFVSYYDLDLG